MSNSLTGYKVGGLDLSYIFQPLVSGTAYPIATGYKIPDGRDLNQIFAVRPATKLNIQNPTPGLNKFSSVACSGDGTLLFACIDTYSNTTFVGNNVWKSSNSGQTWTSDSDVNGLIRWTYIECSGDGQYVYLDSHVASSIWRSSDSGENWVEVNSTGSIDSNSVNKIRSSYDGKNLIGIIPYENRLLYTSSNYGNSWNYSLSIPRGNWKGVAISDNGLKMAVVGDSSKIYTSTNSGSTWNSSNNSPNINWVDITCSANGNILAAAPANGKIYISTDSGVTWTTDPLNNGSSGSQSMEWSAITSSANGEAIFAAAKYGDIWLSTNLGISWSTVQISNTGSKYWQDMRASRDGKVLIAMHWDNATPGIGSGYVYVYNKKTETTTGFTFNGSDLSEIFMKKT